MPRAARSNTPAGAEAFIRFYLGLVNEAWTTPKAGLLPPHSDPGCQFCKKTEEDARDFVETRTRYAGTPIRLGDATVVLSSPREQILDIRITQNAVDIVDRGGKTVEAVPRSVGVYRVGVRWRGDRWVFFDLEGT